MKIITLFLIILICFVNLKAQELGVSAVKLWTDNYEIQNPYGFGISVMQPIWKIGLKAEYISAYNERKFHGFIIWGFMAYPDELLQENVVSKSTYHVIELSLIVPNIIHYEQFGLNLAFGVTFDKFKGERHGLSSGKNVTLYEEDKFGLFYGFQFQKKDYLNCRLKLK